MQYEISMFFQTIPLLIQMGSMKNELSNVLIESVNMRIRILLHFLYPTGQKKEDILAEDFLKNPKIGKVS